MEWSEFIRIVEIPLLVAMIGGMFKMWRDLSDHQLHVAENYAKKEDIEKSEQKIYKMLERIENKLDKVVESKESK